jgi:N-acetylglucosamine-6-phosphate deacetylase
MSMIIANVRLVLPERLAPGSVLVKGGTIAAVAEGAPGDGFPPAWKEAGKAAGAAVEIIDGGGLYLSPGFIDLHNHGRLGRDAMETFNISLDGGVPQSGGTAAGSGEANEPLETIARGQAEHGVTSFLAGTSTIPWEYVPAAVRRIAAFCRESAAGPPEGGKPAARCLGIYSEGSFFSREKRGAHNPRWLKEAISEADLEVLMDAAGETLKVLALSPELPGALPAIRALVGRGVTVSAAHSNAVYAEAQAGIDAGITLSTHTFNGMRALSHQEPGILGAVLNDPRVCCELIADGIHLAPPVLSLVHKIKGSGGVVLVSDSVAPNGLPDGRYEGEGRTVLVRDGTIRLEDGRLAGSSLSLDGAVRNMIRLGGASVPGAVRMASLNPARILGVEDRAGSVAAGKDADLVLFDETISVRAVFIGGKRFQFR